jgi:hemerythrin-like domain-containing protein
MVEEAQVEHNGAKDLIAQIEAADEVDATFDAMVKVLSEYIKHHVNEEETEIFPEVASEKEALDEIGQEMASRKTEIKEELGIAEEAAAEGDGDETDEDASPPQADRGSSQGQRSQRSR